MCAGIGLRTVGALAGVWPRRKGAHTMQTTQSGKKSTILMCKPISSGARITTGTVSISAPARRLA
jgi:hypothetical protein